MENWNSSHNWTKGQFLTAVRSSSDLDKDSLSLDTEHCDRQNLTDMKEWAKEVGYYAKERSGGDILVVSKKPIEEATSEGFIYAGSPAASGDTGKLMRLLELLKKTVPQAEKYWICTANGEVVCQVGDGQLLPSKEEQKGIQSALADFRKVDDRFREMVCDRQMAYGIRFGTRRARHITLSRFEKTPRTLNMFWFAGATTMKSIKSGPHTSLCQTCTCCASKKSRRVPLGPGGLYLIWQRESGCGFG